MKTMPAKESKDFNQNREKFQISWNGEYCAYCGRPVKNPKYWVHEIDGGGTILHPDEDANWYAAIDSGDLEKEAGDLGLQPVGPECAKHFKGWLHK